MATPLSASCRLVGQTTIRHTSSSSSFDLVPLYRRVGRSSHRIPSILQIRVGASLELVEEPVDLVDLLTEAPQLRTIRHTAGRN